MRRIDIVLALNASDVCEPPSSGPVRFVLHRWIEGWRPPPDAGEMVAFIDWLAPQMAGLEICRRLRSDPDDFDGDLGADAKYDINANLTADVTYNTDFAQVEDDGIDCFLLTRGVKCL